MGHKPDSSVADDLCVLNDVRYFDLTTRRWLPAAGKSTLNGNSRTDLQNAFVPRARYAHLSSVTANRLFVIGGQDLNNLWLDDVCVFDLVSHVWIHRREYPRHSGTYRSVAVSADLRVRFPSEEAKSAVHKTSSIGPLGSRFKVEKRPSSSKGDYTSTEKLIHLPYSAEPTDDFPNDIYLYSNYNVRIAFPSS